LRNPKFKALLDKMLEIHDRKNSDYASDDDPYSNFKFAAAYAEIPLYKVYLVIEGIKTARLHQLHKGKTPKNESMDDTYLDKATYAAIEASNLMKELEDNPNICTICNKWIEGTSIGTGDGTGQKFAHEACYRNK